MRHAGFLRLFSRYSFMCADAFMGEWRFPQPFGLHVLLCVQVFVFSNFLCLCIGWRDAHPSACVTAHRAKRIQICLCVAYPGYRYLSTWQIDESFVLPGPSSPGSTPIRIRSSEFLLPKQWCSFLSECFPPALAFFVGKWTGNGE